MEQSLSAPPAADPRREARKYGIRCYSWGTYYKQHIWAWQREIAAPMTPAQRRGEEV